MAFQKATLFLNYKQMTIAGLPTQATVDESNNKVSYNFDDAVSFKAVTASAVNATLTIEDINLATSNIFVYPNPTANLIYIQGDNISKAELFDLMGRKVKATDQNQIDFVTSTMVLLSLKLLQKIIKLNPLKS